MRRLFIIRKDLHLSGGKLSAMVGHCCEAYWTNLLKRSCIIDNEYETLPCYDPVYPNEPLPYHNTELDELSKQSFKSGAKSFKVRKIYPKKSYNITIEISKDIWEEYVNGIFTKTICEAKNKNQLMKIIDLIKEHNDSCEDVKLIEGRDYGFINDKCLTELIPENEDGTTTVGMWFRPLPDDIAHKFSKKYKLYRD